MADIFEAMDKMADVVVSALAPYQPNVPPDYLNPALTAGEIPSTVIGVGQPIQVHLMERMENGLGQVAIWDVRGGKAIPTLSREPLNVYKEGTAEPKEGVQYEEVARFEKLVYVQCFAPTNEYRNKLGDLVLAAFGEGLRISHADGTVTLVRRTNFENINDEQVDTLYQRALIYRADVSMTQPRDVTEVTEAVWSEGTIDDLANHTVTVDML